MRRKESLFHCRLKPEAGTARCNDASRTCRLRTETARAAHRARCAVSLSTATCHRTAARCDAVLPPIAG
ncbi:hypothetical protein DM46_2281 [Burkholderia mallei]|nr:hypothetical protein DM46_2281 [Burkholderia mallei]KOT22128.1 hypothetical protein DM52_2283 [Burkholderia mallei]